MVSFISPKLALEGNFTLFSKTDVIFSAKSPQNLRIFDGKQPPLLRKRQKISCWAVFRVVVDKVPPEKRLVTLLAKL